MKSHTAMSLWKTYPLDHAFVNFRYIFSYGITIAKHIFHTNLPVSWFHNFMVNFTIQGFMQETQFCIEKILMTRIKKIYVILKVDHLAYK